MDLSIIIVNYNTCILTLQCIRSIYTHTPSENLDLEIIVVDNASSDKSEAEVSTNFPSVIWIGLDRNQGFARANNAGIKRARGKFVLLLNSDTIITDDSIYRCYNFLSTWNLVAGCTCQLLNIDNSQQQSHASFDAIYYYCQITPVLGDRLFRYLLEHKYVPTYKNAYSTFSYPNSLVVDWIVGAFMMVNMEAIKRFGVLDENFFMYAEEMEWCYRLNKFGPLILNHETSIVHLIGASAKEEFGKSKQNDFFDKKERQRLVSHLLATRKCFGVSPFVFIMLYLTISILSYFLYSIYSLTKSSKEFMINIKKAINYSKAILFSYKYFLKILVNQRGFYKI